VESARDRLLSRVDRSGECWYWTGRLNSDGYGSFDVGGTSMLAHRASWTLHRGPVPAGMHVLHSCDKVGDRADKKSRRCVRPEHLYLGTHQRNMRDMAERGRANRPLGERNPRARIRAADVPGIRARWAAGARQVDLAAEYGVRQTTISAIVRGETWGRAR